MNFASAAGIGSAPCRGKDALSRDPRGRLGTHLLHRCDPRLHVVAERWRGLARRRDQHQRRDKFGPQQRQLLRDHTALRQPDDAHAGKPERVRERRIVAREHIHVIGPVRLVRSAVAPRIGRDHADNAPRASRPSGSRANDPSPAHEGGARPARCRPRRCSSSDPEWRLAAPTPPMASETSRSWAAPSLHGRHGNLCSKLRYHDVSSRGQQATRHLHRTQPDQIPR